MWLNEYETLDDARRGIGGYDDVQLSAYVASAALWAWRTLIASSRSRSAQNWSVSLSRRR